MVEEKGSVRGKWWVARICSPLRMCHPMSGSASGRFDNGPARSDQNRKIKMMSRTDGLRIRESGELRDAAVIVECWIGVCSAEAVYNVLTVAGRILQPFRGSD